MKPALFTFLILFVSIVFVQAQDDEFKLNETYRISPNGTLKLDSDDARVSIVGSNRKDVKVDIYRKVETKGIQFGSRDFEIIVEEEHGNLHIFERTSGGSISMIGYYSEEYTIDIEVPASVNLDIEGDDDDYLISQMNGNIELDIDDGDVILRNCRPITFNADIDDGDIEADQLFGKVKLDIDDGDVVILDGNITDLTVYVDDGDIEVHTAMTGSGEYYLKGDDCTIELYALEGGASFDIRHDDSRIRTGDNYRITEEDEHYMNVTLNDGNTKVKIRVDDASIRLN